MDPAGLTDVPAATVVMAADRDVIDPDHTRLIARSIPGAQLCVGPRDHAQLVREQRGLVGRVVAELPASV